MKIMKAMPQESKSESLLFPSVCLLVNPPPSENDAHLFLGFISSSLSSSGSHRFPHYKFIALLRKRSNLSNRSSLFSLLMTQNTFAGNDLFSSLKVFLYQ